MAVSYVSNGAFASGTGALTVGVPAGHADGDLFLLMVNSANQTIATPSGWTQVSNSPQGTGTAAAAGGVRLAVFWKLVSGTQSSQSVADSGNYTTAIMSCWRGVDPAAPIHVTAGSVGASSASLTWPAVTTTVPACMIINAVGLDFDGNSTARLGSWTNANLASITERHDQTVNAGAGGGIGFSSGILASAGSTGSTTATETAATTHTYLTIALAPGAITGTTTLDGSGDILAVGHAIRFASGTIVGAGNLAAAGSKFSIIPGTGTIIGTGSLAASGTRFSIIPGTATLTGAGTLSPSATRFSIIFGSGLLSGTTGISTIVELISGVPTVFGAGTFTGSATVTARSSTLLAVLSGAVFQTRSLVESGTGPVFDANGQLSVPEIIEDSTSMHIDAAGNIHLAEYIEGGLN